MTLIARDLRVQIDNKTIVDGVSFDVRAGDKVGLVGRNGAGKTTLFRVLGGANDPHRGTIRRADATGYLSQDPRSDHVPPDTSCLAHVLSGRGLDEAMARIEKLTVAMAEDASDRNIARFSEAMEHFESLGGYAAESEARRLTAGLGLSADRLDLTVGALSGGERRRLELARILFAGSELLLLDEPTNHLDADARDWLLQFLVDFRGALIVISHDLGLLDESITRVMHLDRDGEDDVGTLVEYRGTYSKYLTDRELEEERLGKLVDRQAKEIKRLSDRADAMRGQSAKRAACREGSRCPSRTTRSRASRRARAASQHRGAAPRPSPVGPHGPRGVSAREVLRRAVDVFSDVSFDIGRGERMIIMGLNGAGKTTLLKLLAGVSTPDIGTVRSGERTTIGYYAQEHEGIEDGEVPARPHALHRAHRRPGGPQRHGHVRPPGRQGVPGRGHPLRW